MEDDSAIALAVVKAEVVDESVELDMSAVEARTTVTEIKNHLNQVRVLLLALDERRGWKALGYESMRQCMLHEFKDTGSKLRQLYRELKAAHIEKVVCPRGHIGEIPEGHLRDLSKLPPEQWFSAWNEVVATAPRKGVTTKHAARVVESLLEKSKQQENSVVATDLQEDFAIGDWVEVRQPSTWYGKQGTVTRIEQYEITVQIDDGKWKFLRFYREDLVKVLPFERNATAQKSFYKPGDLLLIDCPKNVDCDYKRYNDCWAVVIGIGELGGIQVQLAGKKANVMSSDTEPIDNPSDELRQVAEKVNKLLALDKLDEFDRETLQLYLRRQVFTSRQLQHLAQIWNAYNES